MSGPNRTAGLRGRAAALRQRLYARAVDWRSRLMLHVFLPLRAQRTARLHYAAVLDGQTVNFHAELPRSAGLPDRADIVLRRGRVRHRTEARVYRGSADTVLMDAAVLLGAELGGAPVADGRWKVRLRLRQGRRSRTLPLLLVEPPVPYDGPTKPMQASPVTGARYRVGRSVTGNVRIVAAAARPGAEVVKVHIAHSGIEVDFRLLGTEVTDPWAEFTASGRRLRQDVRPAGPDTWRVTVPLDEMTPRKARPEHWDVAVCSQTTRRMRLGRRLHDVRNPLRVFAMRSIAVTPRGQAPMIVQPRYTPAGNLRVTCTRMPEAG
ncbi:hypothetical protein [Streptomyces sp. NPDC046712]|uniref:hypothetical protein n=1 Tax=Streptomyces sp. NPDC046712 TaxID=3154802 RepID=UPI003410360A